MKNKAVFLDRDGVLNEAIIKNGKPYPPVNLADLIIPDGVKESLSSLKSAGYLLIGATNQPDVARGTTTRANVEVINNKIMQILPLESIRVCYHDDHHNCVCRKPSPGLLLQAAQDYDIDLSQSVMIGDRWKDVAAGVNAGCKTIWLESNYKEVKPEKVDYIAQSLQMAADWIINHLGDALCDVSQT